MLGVLYWHPACFVAIIVLLLLIVTIVEVHQLILDVCVYKRNSSSKEFVYKIILNSFIKVCAVSQLILNNNITVTYSMKLITNHS